MKNVLRNRCTSKIRPRFDQLQVEENIRLYKMLQLTPNFDFQSSSPLQCALGFTSTIWSTMMHPRTELLCKLFLVTQHGYRKLRVHMFFIQHRASLCLCLRLKRWAMPTLFILHLLFRNPKRLLELVFLWSCMHKKLTVIQKSEMVVGTYESMEEFRFQIQI